MTRKSLSPENQALHLRARMASGYHLRRSSNVLPLLRFIWHI